MSSTNTPDKSTNSPPPSSAESSKTPTAVSPPAGHGGFSKEELEQLKNLLQIAMRPLEDKMSNLERNLENKMSNLENKMSNLESNLEDKMSNLEDKMSNLEDKMSNLEKGMSRLEKKTGLLVEEKARKMAARQFGEDFSRSFIIKSPHDLVKLLANSNINKLEKDDCIARNKAVDKLANFLKSLLPVFGKVAVEEVNDTLKCNSNLFQNGAFDDAIKSFEQNAVGPIKGAAKQELKNLDWQKIYGCTIKLVTTLSEKNPHVEGVDASGERAKLMNGRFKRKLERLKLAVTDDDLASGNSPGIMLLSAIANAPPNIWKSNVSELSKWIENNCQLFDYKEEIECDLMPSVSAVSDHATIMVGEIKSSIAAYRQAKKQMLCIANILHFGLVYVTDGEFHSVIKKGHLYVLEAEKNDQRFPAQVDQGISIFVHKAS